MSRGMVPDEIGEKRADGRELREHENAPVEQAHNDLVSGLGLAFRVHGL